MSAAAAFSDDGRPSLDEIKASLRDDAENLFRTLFGEPNRDTLRRQEWRWGTHGSLAAIVRDGNGKRRGSFYTHEGSQGGSPLDAIMFARGCGFRDAVGWATHWLGLDAPGYTPPPVNDAVLEERARQRAQQEREAEEHRRQRTETAARIWAESVSFIDTLGDIYLRNRAIVLPEDASLPVRWHVASGALVFAATLADGTVQAIQRVYIGTNAQKLDQEGLDRRRLPSAKVTTGPADGAAVRLPGSADRVICATEGLETGLSVWQATGHETWIALGQLAKLEPPSGRLVVLCRDDDRKKKSGQTGPSAEDRHRKLLAELRGRGLQVVTALPWLDRRFDGSDFNDVLQVEGDDAVRARIAAVTPPDLPPEFTPPTHTLEQARAELDPKVAGFFREAVEASVQIETFLKRQRLRSGSWNRWKPQPRSWMSRPNSRANG